MQKIRKRSNSFFKKVDKDIVFVYNGVNEIVFTKAKDSSANDTRAMLVSGLNHFIHYVDTVCDDKDMVLLERYIINTYLNMVNRENSIKSSRDYDKELKLMLEEFCSIENEDIVDLIASYVHHISITNIDESKATTDITLTTRHTLILHIISVMIKLSFVFSAITRSDMTYNNVLTLFVDRLSNNAYRGYLKSIGKPYQDRADIDEIATEIDEYLYKYVAKQWGDNISSVSYADKFKHTGIDHMLHTKKNKVDMYSSLKKYIPVAENAKILAKYTSDSKENVYWTADKDFNDFKFVSLNTVGWIEPTLRTIIASQDLKRTFEQDINVVGILISSNDESSLRRDNSLYEDKEGHLLEIRQTSGKAIFQMVVDEIEKYDFDIRTEIKKFNDETNHPFNQFILSKIFLSLTGEHRVYKELFGSFNKVVLSLFYIKVLDNIDLEFFHPTIEIMKSMGKPNVDIYKTSQIEEFLNMNELDVDPILFKNVLGVYRDEKSNNVLTLEANNFYKLFKYLESPARVRHMLFPDTYEPMDKDTNDLSRFTNVDLKVANELRLLVIGDTYE
ncbi:MAG: hypothetical protein ACRCX2_13540 [Paraclostridium sp.]